MALTSLDWACTELQHSISEQRMMSYLSTNTRFPVLMVVVLICSNRDWWFASTAIPLIAATSGPLANVCSIAALVTSWRARVQPGSQPIVRMSNAVGYPDPHWYEILQSDVESID
jgi:hypothetical protein